MDLNNLGMDFSIEEEYFEIKDDRSLLPDEVLVIIFSKLSWKEINIPKHVSRRFYNIINNNYHKLERRKVENFWKKDHKNSDSQIIDVKMSFYDGNLRKSQWVFITEDTYIQSDQELLRFLKKFDMKNLRYIEVYGYCDPCIFDILNRSLPTGTNIGILHIFELKEEGLKSFRLFVEEHSSIENLCIMDICSSSKGVEDVYSQLSLSFLHSIKAFSTSEYPETEILSADLVTKLLRENPNIKVINIEGARNIKFVRGILKKYSTTMEQPRKIEDKCGYGETTLRVAFYGRFDILFRILRKELKELGEIEDFSFGRGLSTIFIYLY